MVVALLEFFKCESSERMHVISIANETKSDIRVRMWLERVAEILVRETKKDGPAFCEKDDFILSKCRIERVMHPFLEELQGAKGLEQVLPKGVDVATYYRCARSF